MNTKVFVFLAVLCAAWAGNNLAHLLGHYFVVGRYDLEIVTISVLFCLSIGLFILAGARMIVGVIKKR